MSILVDERTCLLVQGITGKEGRTHTKRSLEAGVCVAAGVTPGKAGAEVLGVPVYDHVADALRAHPAINASMILVPPKAVLSAAMEAIEAGLKLVVIITEFVPVHDALRIVHRAEAVGATVVGPNTIGVISPGRSKVGIMPDYIYKRGHIGIISRSGTMTHEVASNLSFAGYGQSTCLGIGGDMVVGLSHTDGLKMFRDDPDTDCVVLLGEIGGTSEEDAAEYVKDTQYPKPVLAYIAGAQAPAGKKMGHAGAIVSGGKGSAASKIEALRQAGVGVAESVGQLLGLVKELDVRLDGKLQTVEPIPDID
ncbi:MAG: succinate--CoA ligase subunit alpha [Oscillospiraceae bacterium]